MLKEYVTLDAGVVETLNRAYIFGFLKTAYSRLQLRKSHLPALILCLGSTKREVKILFQMQIVVVNVYSLNVEAGFA